MKSWYVITIAIMAAAILLLIMAFCNAHQRVKQLEEDLAIKEILFRKMEKHAMDQKAIAEKLKAQNPKRREDIEDDP